MQKFIIFILFLLIGGSGFIVSQEVKRTPELEAANQTEKMQKELNLSKEQTKAVYQIQLKYAKERQSSNSRSEALQRVRNKKSDLKKVLEKDQFNQLQNKRLERNNNPSNGVPRRSTNPVRPMESNKGEYRENNRNNMESNERRTNEKNFNNQSMPSSMRFQEYRNSQSRGGSRNR